MSHDRGLRRPWSMRIAIAGGTGTLGRRVVAALRGRGHQVRVLSRSSAEYPVDLTTGDGLAAALDGCDVVVDAVNSTKAAAATLVEGSRRLLAAGHAAGLGHHVCVSIVGCDRVPLDYFRVKAEQERVVAAGPVPWTVVRITQSGPEVVDARELARRWPAAGAPAPAAARCCSRSRCPAGSAARSAPASSPPAPPASTPPPPSPPGSPRSPGDRGHR